MSEATDADRSEVAMPDQTSGATATTEPITPIELSILIEARPETVYSILSDPEKFVSWMGAARGSFIAEIGSPFELEFPKFGTTIAGEVLEFVENERVVVTWGVAEGPQAADLPAGSTRVEFRLEQEGSSTRLHLVHSGLPSIKERDNNEAGWRFHGARLALLANRASLALAVDGLAVSFFGAWNEPDAAKRANLLEESCTPELHFTDEYATLTGRDRLSLHIGNTQGYMPGSRVEPDGDATICLGEALIPWKILDVDGNVTHRGINHANITPDGRFSAVKGFWK